MTALAVFLEHFDDPTTLRSLVAEVIRRDPNRIVRQSRETTTHYKWLLASDEAMCTKLWLHEFKPAGLRRPGYASSVHNHRYPFKAVALAGGYTNKRCHVIFEAETLQIGEIDVLSREPFLVGTGYALEPDEFHCVDEIQDGTQSLIAEFAAVRSASFSVDPKSDHLIKHVPLENRVRDLLRITEAH